MTSVCECASVGVTVFVYVSVCECVNDCVSACECMSVCICICAMKRFQGEKSVNQTTFYLPGTKCPVTCK